MSFLLVAMVASTLGTRPETARPMCPGSSTIEINACLSARLDDATRTLTVYRTTARKRIVADVEAANRATTIAGFDAAQGAWERYAEATCQTVDDYWRGGSIHTTFNIVCRLRLTQIETHGLWINWLRYVDSTPPILPEPVVESGN